MNDLQRKYLAEVEHRLRRAGFEAGPEYNGLLPIQKDAHQLCTINMHGGVSYDPDFVRRNGQEDVLDQARQIAVETLTYMRQMASAPLLTADGLSGDYRVLAEFDNVVLAGHEREGGYGVEFITWERIQNGTGLWQGNYYENNYAAAKQNFATRSGLIPSALLFTPEQMAVIFDAAQNMTTDGFVSNPKQEKLLVMEQIEEVVPEVIDLANELTQYPKQHELGGMEQI